VLRAGKNVLIVTHGNVVRLLAKYLGNVHCVSVPHGLRVCAFWFRTWCIRFRSWLCGKYLPLLVSCVSCVCRILQLHEHTPTHTHIHPHMHAYTQRHTHTHTLTHTHTHTDNLSDEEVEGIDIPQCTPLVYTLRRADLRYTSTAGHFCHVRSLRDGSWASFATEAYLRRGMLP